MKSIFERLFNGEIYPSEKAIPKTDAYRTALQELQNANAALEDALDERQKELLHELLESREAVSYQEYVCIYGEGVRFGVELMAEVYHMGETHTLIPT